MWRFIQKTPLRNFDIATWKRRYTDWTRNKKLTSADMFRVYKDVLTRKQFVDGLLATST